MNFFFTAIIFLLVAWGVASVSTLTFASSLDMSGPIIWFGQRVERGIAAAFKEVNDQGGVRGIILNHTYLDDGYVPARAKNNTRAFIADPNVFALLVPLGSATVATSLPDILASDIPLISPYTGAMPFRTPFLRQVINIRASYEDESTAWLNYLYGERRMTKIASFYQNDTFGLSSHAGVVRGLNALGLEPVAVATYDLFNASTSADAVMAIASAKPEAVVLCAIWRHIVVFMEEAVRLNAFPPETMFMMLTVATGGGRAVHLSKPAPWANLISTQINPLPDDRRYQVVRRYQAAMTALDGPTAEFSVAGLEAYIAARMTIQVIESTPVLTRANFVDTVYRQRVFMVDDLQIGMFGDRCVAGSMLTGKCECNQGLHTVWYSQWNSTTQRDEVIPIQGLEIPSHECFSSPLQLKRSAAFAMVNEPGNTEGLWRLAGIQAAFNGMTRRGSTDVQLKVTPVTPAEAANVTSLVTKERLTGILGGVVNHAYYNSLTPDVIRFDLWSTKSIGARLHHDTPNYDLVMSLTTEEEIFTLLHFAVTRDDSSQIHLAVGSEVSNRDQLITIASAALDTLAPDRTFTSVSTDGVVASGYVLALFDDDAKTTALITDISGKSGAKLLVPMRAFARTNSSIPAASRARVFFPTTHNDLLNTTSTFAFEFLDDTKEGVALALRKNPVFQHAYIVGRAFASPFARSETPIRTPEHLRQAFYDAQFIAGQISFGPFLDGSSCVRGDCHCNRGISRGTVYSGTMAFQSETMKPVCFFQYRLKTADLLSIVIPVAVVSFVIVVGSVLAVVFLRKQGRDNGAAPINQDEPFVMMFTDIENSTALWGHNAEVMAEALSAHNDIIEAVVAKHGLYKVKTIGDSFMVAGKSCISAINFAMEIQEKLFNYDWQTHVIDDFYRKRNNEKLPDSQYDELWGGIRVRVGINYGKGDIRFDDTTQGYDYFGSVVNVAARVESVAHGGQVVATSSFMRQYEIEKAQSSAKASLYQIEEKNLGTHQLKGVAELTPLTQLLPAMFSARQFPPLRVSVLAEDVDDAVGTDSIGSARSKRSSTRNTDRELLAKALGYAQLHSCVQTIPIPTIKNYLLMTTDILDDLVKNLPAAERNAVMTTLSKCWGVTSANFNSHFTRQNTLLSISRRLCECPRQITAMANAGRSDALGTEGAAPLDQEVVKSSSLAVTTLQDDQNEQHPLAPSAS